VKQDFVEVFIQNSFSVIFIHTHIWPYSGKYHDVSLVLIYIAVPSVLPLFTVKFCIN
jgi:hypothetical protein